MHPVALALFIACFFKGQFLLLCVCLGIIWCYRLLPSVPHVTAIRENIYASFPYPKLLFNEDEDTLKNQASYLRFVLQNWSKSNRGQGCWAKLPNQGRIGESEARGGRIYWGTCREAGPVEFGDSQRRGPLLWIVWLQGLCDGFLEGLALESPFVIFSINYPPPPNPRHWFFFSVSSLVSKEKVSRLDFLLVSSAFVKRPYAGPFPILHKEIELQTLIEE